MTLKSISILGIAIIIYFIMYNFLGGGITTLIFSIIFLIQAILFTFKSEYYDKFMKFMNSRLYNEYSKKGDKFIKKNRKINIRLYYILSAITGINALNQLTLMNNTNTKIIFDLKEIIVSTLIILVIIFIIERISTVLVKKSDTAGEYLVWSTIFGGLIGIILIGIVVWYIMFTLI